MVSRVLDSQCDAVVLLDESLCIDAAGSTQLASLLMHPSASSTSPLQGVPLTDLVMSEDHERFQQFMIRELDAARNGFGMHAPIASSLQINLRDSLRIPVPVEIFCSCSLGSEGSGIGPMQYLLGIREQEAKHVRQQERPPENIHNRAGTRARSRACPHAHCRATRDYQTVMTQQLDYVSE